MQFPKLPMVACFLLFNWHSVVAFGSTELSFLNWADYMDPDILQQFEERTGITVKQIYFESDATRDELLLETDGKGFDLAIVNGSSLYILAKRGWLEPVNEKDIANLKLIDKRWRATQKSSEEYGVPYFWGTLGIAYRKDLVSGPVTSWMDLMRPQPALQGKIGMIRDSKEIIGASLKALNYSLNSTDSKELNEAEILLAEQSPYVKTYDYLALDENSALVSGEIAMSMMYSGDALMVQEHNENISYVLPKEGGGIWVDYISILKNSVNKAAAKQFINFINEPEIAAQLAQYVYYASPNMAAEKLLPEDFTADPSIYPSGAAMEKSESFQLLPARVIKKRASIFSRIVK